MGCTHRGTAEKSGSLRDRVWEGDTGALWLLPLPWLGGRDSGLLVLWIPVPFQHPPNPDPARWGLCKNCITSELSLIQFDLIQHPH